jgi:hypothetical protein
MSLLDPGKRLNTDGDQVGRQHLYELFHGVEIYAIDDIGTEELAYVARDMITQARHNRYREAFEYFYQNHISILVTSMIPLMRNGKLNPDFINIIGPAAFDRLYERAKGYMFDLTGLPSYRQIMAGKHNG